MKHHVYRLLLALILVLALAVPAFASAEALPLVDSADLLTAEEEQEIITRLEKAGDLADMDIAIFIDYYEWFDTSMEAYAEECYDLMFGETDGILLLIAPTEDWSSVEYWYSTSGDGMELFDDDALDALDAAVVPELSDRNFYAACQAFADTCAEIAEDAQPNYVLRGIVALIIGAILSFLIPMSVLKGQLKTVRNETAAANYVREGSMNLTQEKDIFLYRRVTRTAKPKNNSSGSNSSGGSHGGRGGSV